LRVAAIAAMIYHRHGAMPALETRMGEKFERHRQPWRQDEIQKLHVLAGKGMSLRAIARALTRSEESVQTRARADKLTISKLR
jgi:DNA-binding NarL/FixJ family response regulator